MAWWSPNDTSQIREWLSVSHLVRERLLDGGAKGTRTPDLLVANETRYQLRHSPADRGGPISTETLPPSGGGYLARFAAWIC